ncbi:(d)CMP kinase [Serpentinicella alkaliphila]|uniref:Cytidylate kinase n=1 Tax=Serpentinicella alkaliphila TaxID=1734049 RepID=A0A4R2T1K3_9FIRM|nr:(d)CMP kinase [Serpentinicella alkaliphila]QUH26354.1 (d)CMP kinase [Serpentinicella alkaliphila]TCP96787.1 cytidylate kinase [Serpentinicella alkaliphila]
MHYIQIAIDGPAGAGKSTIAKKIAKKLGILYIDTGAMYRALTYKVVKLKVDINNIEKINEIAKETNIEFRNGIIFLDGIDVSLEIRSQEVTKLVSFVAQIPEVRVILVELQKKVANNNHVVMDGRDIGSNVLPNADVKVFLTASVSERAKRRYLEMLEKNSDLTLAVEDIEKDIKLRDKMDSEREASPLIKAKDAIVLDTTLFTIDQVVEEILNILSKKNIIDYLTDTCIIENRA